MADFKIGQQVQCKNDGGLLAPYGEQTPVYGRCYTIREIIAKPTGPCLRLREIVNPPAHYADGETECSFSATRFEAGAPPMPFFTVRGPLPISGAAPSWTPTDLGSALRLWIKADTGTSTTGGLIDSIADQSGNGFNLISASTNRPTLNATGYNSHPSIDFSAASSTYLGTQTFPLNSDPKNFSLGTASSFFFIGQMDTGTSSFGRAITYLGGVSASSGAHNDFSATDSVCAILRDTATNAVCMYQAAAAAGASGAVSLNTNMRVLMVFDNVNATLYINNVQAAQTAASFTLGSTGIFALGTELAASGGATALGAGFWDGTMAEVLVTNTALDSTTRANLDAYVVARLGA